MTSINIPLNSNGDNSTVGDEIIPEWLREGGTVDGFLQEALQAGYQVKDWQLRDVITNQLTKVRIECRRSSTGQLSNILSNVDTVFRVCLAEIAGLEITNPQYNEAYQAYATKPDDYRAVLGELIPESFREWADDLISQEAYRNGTNPTSLADWGQFLKELNNEVNRAEVGLCCKSDLPSLDHAIMRLDGLNFIGGPKGFGKTTLLLSIAHSLLKVDTNLAVLIYTLEMEKSRLLTRLLSREAGVDARTLKLGMREPGLAEKLGRADQDIREILSRLRLIERQQVKHYGGFSKTMLTKDSRQLMHQSGASKVLVIIDNFQRMDVPGKIFTSADDDEATRIATDAAKDDFRLDALQDFRFAMRSDSQPNGPPVIAASEITKRENARRNGQVRELSVDDLRGSGRLASDAETILLLWPNKEDFNGADVVPLTLRIAKGRDGVIRKDIAVDFHHTYSRFSERQPEVSSKQTTRGVRKQSKVAGCSGVDPLSDA